MKSNLANERNPRRPSPSSPNGSPSIHRGDRISPMHLLRALMRSDRVGRKGRCVGTALLLCTSNRTGEARSVPVDPRCLPATYDMLRELSRACRSDVSAGLDELVEARWLVRTRTLQGSILRWTDRAIAAQEAARAPGAAARDAAAATGSARTPRRTPILTTDERDLAVSLAFSAKETSPTPVVGPVVSQPDIGGAPDAGEDAPRSSARGCEADAGPKNAPAAARDGGIAIPTKASGGTLDATRPLSARDVLRACYADAARAKHGEKARVREPAPHVWIAIEGAVGELCARTGRGTDDVGRRVMAAYLDRTSTWLEAERHPLPAIVRDLDQVIEAVSADLNRAARKRAAIEHERRKNEGAAPPRRGLADAAAVLAGVAAATRKARAA